uniref:HOX-like protein 8 n=1 Tax=Parasacculina yatsui TaxID=2836420 RepID=A0A8K1VDD4_9CRUS|nr:HOX-like protein 8 [Parasacculina yatsui]
MKLRELSLETASVGSGPGKVDSPPISQALLPPSVALLPPSETFGSTLAKNERNNWDQFEDGRQLFMSELTPNVFPSEVQQTYLPDQPEPRLNPSGLAYNRSFDHPVKKSSSPEMSSELRTVLAQDQQQQQQQAFSADCFQQFGLGDVLDSSSLQIGFSSPILPTGSRSSNPVPQSLNQPPIASRSPFEQMEASKSSDTCGLGTAATVAATSANFVGAGLHQYGSQPLQSPTVNQSNQQESLSQTAAPCTTAPPPPFSTSVGQLVGGSSVIVSTSSASCDYSPLSSPASDRSHQRHLNLHNHQHHNNHHHPHHQPHHQQMQQNSSQHVVQHNNNHHNHQPQHQQLSVSHQSSSQHYQYVGVDQQSSLQDGRHFASPNDARDVGTMLEPTAVAATAAGIELGQSFDPVRPPSQSFDPARPPNQSFDHARPLLQPTVMVNLPPGVYYGDTLVAGPEDPAALTGAGYTVLQQVPYDAASFPADQSAVTYSAMLAPGHSRSSSSVNSLDGVVLVESMQTNSAVVAPGSSVEWRTSTEEFQASAGACGYSGGIPGQEYQEDQAVFVNPSGYDATFRQRKKRPFILSMASQGSGHSFQSNLRSPALFNPGDGSTNSPPPYTPPPILPPSRAGSGLYWNLLAESGLAGSYPSSSSGTSQCPPLQDQQDYCSELPPETDVKPHPNIGPMYQAEVPEVLNNEPLSTHHADLLWNPRYLEHIEQRELDLYLEFACCASSPAGGRSKEYALCLLHMNYGNIKNSMLQLMQPLPHLPNGHPLQDFTYMESLKWSPREIQTLQNALARYNKDFRLVAQEIGTRTVRQCVQFYYYWKKVCTREYLQLRNYRLQRANQQLQPLHGFPTSNNCQQLQPVSVQPLFNEPTALQPMLSLDGNATLALPSRTSMPAPPPSQQLYQHNVMDYRTGYDSTDTLHQKYRPPHLPHVRLQLSQTGARSPTPDLRSHQVPVASPASSQGDATEDFPCKLCGKVFHKVKSRNAHMKSHRPIDAESKRKSSMARSPALGRGRGARLIAAHRAPPEVAMCLDSSLIQPGPNYIIPNV